MVRGVGKAEVPSPHSFFLSLLPGIGAGLNGLSEGFTLGEPTKTPSFFFHLDLTKHTQERCCVTLDQSLPFGERGEGAGIPKGNTEV